MKFYIKLNFQTSLQKAMAQNSILLFNILQKRTQKFAPLFSKASIDSWENPVALLIGIFTLWKFANFRQRKKITTFAAHPRPGSSTDRIEVS